MKLTLLTLAALTIGASAAPAPNAEAEPWCVRPGQSCWKAKREAEPWCVRPGQSCWKVKRVAEAFTDALGSAGGIVARSEDGSRAAAAAKRSIEELAYLIALTEEDPEAFYGGLGLDGGDAAATEKRDVDESANLFTRWCVRPGQSCWKREALADDNDKRWCVRPGQSCWKAKRVAEAVAEAVGDADNSDFGLSRHEADAADEAAKRWCVRPGQSCWKAKRDLSAIGVAARDIVAALE